jgi:hypothetical protein
MMFSVTLHQYNISFFFKDIFENTEISEMGGASPHPPRDRWGFAPPTSPYLLLISEIGGASPHLLLISEICGASPHYLHPMKNEVKFFEIFQKLF